jgi:hypothetical protein
MPKNTLIKCIVNGKELRLFNYEALTGEFFSRLLKLPNIKSIEVSDPNLEDKLTKDEFSQLAQRFEYLAPKVRKPEPLPLEEFETPTEKPKQTRKPKTDAN